MTTTVQPEPTLLAVPESGIKSSGSLDDIFDSLQQMLKEESASAQASHTVGRRRSSSDAMDLAALLEKKKKFVSGRLVRKVGKKVSSMRDYIRIS